MYDFYKLCKHTGQELCNCVKDGMYMYLNLRIHTNKIFNLQNCNLHIQAYVAVHVCTNTCIRSRLCAYVRVCLYRLNMTRTYI